MTRLEKLKGHLGAVEEALAANPDPEKHAELLETARHLRLAVSEAEGRSLTGAGSKRP